MPQLPVLTQRALVMGKIESTYNTDSDPQAATDSFLVSEADFRIDPNVLERNFYRPSLSPLPIAVGRKLATLSFRHELKGSGVAGVTPKLGTLLRACGFAQTTIPATLAAVVSNPRVNAGNTGPVVTWTKATLPNKNYGRYNLRVTIAGASATAKVRVTGNPHEGDDLTILPSEEFSSFVMNKGRQPGTTVTVDDVTNPESVTYKIGGTPVAGEFIVACVGGVYIRATVPATPTLDTTAAALAAALTAAAAGRWTVSAATDTVTVTDLVGGVVVTTGTTMINLGASGGQLNMAWTGSLVLNDRWTVDLTQPGMLYNPISTGFESMTMVVIYDGNLHRLTGCMGNVQVTAEAGNYATAQFSFTGQYIDPSDAPLPTDAVFEASNPQQVELAQLQLGAGKFLKAQSFTVDMGVQVNPRDSVSHSDGYFGVQYTSRAPSGGLNPEMTYESEVPYWRQMSQAKMLRFHARVGTFPNNIVRVYSNTAQLSGLNYADRNSNRTYDMSLRFSQDQFSGDDELFFSFH